MRRPRIRPGIATVLTVNMVTVITLLITITTVLDTHRQRGVFQEGIERITLTVVNTVSEALTQSVANADITGLRQVAAVATSAPDSLYVRVFSKDGTIVFATSPREYPIDPRVYVFIDDVRGTGSYTSYTEDGVLHAIAPIFEDGAIIGFFEYGVSTRSLDERIQQTTLEAILEGVALALVGASVAFLLAQYYSRPITKLVTATREIAGGNLNVTIDEQRGDEIGELAQSFTVMTNALKESRSTLEQRNTEIVSANRRLTEEIAERRKVEAALRESRGRIVTVAESLRRDIATHMHGSVQNKLILLLHRLNDTKRIADSQEVVERLDDVTGHIEKLIEDDVRQITQQLYPSILRRGLTSALLSLADRFEDILDIRMDIDASLLERERDASGVVPEQVRLSAYRVVEEALTNVMKHAETKTVQVRVDTPSPEELRIVVQDEGAGFDPNVEVGGLGIGTMRDYADVAGGECTIESRPGEGVTITVVLPMHQ